MIRTFLHHLRRPKVAEPTPTALDLAAADVVRLRAELAYAHANNMRLYRSALAFRERYLEVLVAVAPDIAKQLREQWAQMEAPHHVQQLLRKASHG